MKKKLLLFFGIVLMLAIFSGCSSKEADELVELQNDMKENIADPMFNISEDYEQKGNQLDTSELTPEEFIDYYEEEVEPSIADMRDYMDNYKAPTTDDASEYFGLLTEGLDIGLQVLEKSAELVIVLVDESSSEDDLFELANEMEELGEQLDDKDEEVLKMQDELQEKYNVEFEEIDLED